MDIKGFSIIELVMVMILISILAVVAIPRFIDLTALSEKRVTEQEMETLKRAIAGNPDMIAAGTYSARGYEIDVGALPPNLNALVTNPGVPAWNRYTRTGWNGPYVDDAGGTGDYLIDAWNNSYTYDQAGRRIISNGPDGIFDNGTADDIVVNF
ncbi:MAG: type II secretion system protein [Thermodesulfobacteriota bacterium]